MAELDPAAAAELALPYLERAGLLEAPAGTEARARVERVVAAAGDRMKIAGDILDYRDFFTPDDRLPYEQKAFDKRIRRPEGAVDRLSRFRDRLAKTEPFDEATLEGAMKEFIEAEGIKIGQIIHAVRVAVTGKAVGFGMFETLAILGRDAVLARIDRALEIGREPGGPAAG